MPRESESQRAVSAELQAQLPAQRLSSVPAPGFGIPSLPRFLCQETAAHHLISGGKEGTGRRQPRLPGRQLVPRRGPGGSSGIIWGAQERTFSRHFCNSGPVQPHRCEGLGAPPQGAQQHPRKASQLPEESRLHCVGDWEALFTERGMKPGPAPWCSPIKGSEQRLERVAFGHSGLLAGSPRLHQGAHTQPHRSTLKDQARLLAVIPASEGTFQEPPPCYWAGLAEVETGCCSQLPKAMDRNALVLGNGFVEIKPRPGQFGPLPCTLSSSCLVPEFLMQPSLLSI